MYKTIRHTRKALAVTLVDPCFLSGICTVDIRKNASFQSAVGDNIHTKNASRWRGNWQDNLLKVCRILP